MQKKLLFASFVVFASVFIKLTIDIGLFIRPIENHTNYNYCEFLDIKTPGPEDIVAYNSTVLIYTSNNIFQMMYLNQSDDCGLYVIYNADEVSYDSF
jgi:hypothetical protein